MMPPKITPKKPKRACYAQHLGGCGGRMSGEHYLSEALLKKIESDEGGVWVSGYPWQKDPGRRERIGINSLVGNVLCKNHNSQLSTLDSEALALVEAIEQSTLDGRGTTVSSIDGQLIERFLLKILCGLLASQGHRLPEHKGASLPQRWVDVVFGVRRLPRNAGLYVPFELGDTWDADTKTYFLSTIIASREVVGIGAVINNRRFVLTTRPPPRLRAGALPATSLWHPGRLVVRYRGGEHHLRLNWPAAEGPRPKVYFRRGGGSA